MTKVIIIKRTKDGVKGDASRTGYSCASDPWVSLPRTITSIAVCRDSTSCKSLGMIGVFTSNSTLRFFLHISVTKPSLNEPDARSGSVIVSSGIRGCFIGTDQHTVCGNLPVRITKPTAYRVSIWRARVLKLLSYLARNRWLFKDLDVWFLPMMQY